MIRTIFGVHIPPRRRNARKVLYTLPFVLTGTIPSKKNRQRARISWKPAMTLAKTMIAEKGSLSLADLYVILKALVPYVSPPPEFDNWNKQARSIIVQQAAVHAARCKGLMFPITTRCRIKIYHYWMDNDVRDNSNKAETIHDMLVEAGIIAGDNWQCLYRNEAEAELYRGEILDHITEISLTVYDSK
jgi:hypothetical protein